MSISLFLPRTCSLGNGILTHPRHRHQLALILARRGTAPQACLSHAMDFARVEGHRLDGRARQRRHRLFLHVRFNFSFD